MLTELAGEREYRVGRLFARPDGLDDLDQLHHGRRVEEVHPRHLLRPLGRRRQRDHRQRRGRACKDRVPRSDRIELPEVVELDLELFGDRFDHDVAIGEGVELGRAVDERDRRFHLVLGHLAALHGLRQRLLDRSQRLGHTLLAARAQHDAVPALGRNLRDPVRHRSRPEHADLADVRRSCVRDVAPVAPGLLDPRRARLFVLVEPTPRLPAEEAGGHELLDQRRRRVHRLAELAVHRVEDLVRRIQADQVE